MAEDTQDQAVFLYDDFFSEPGDRGVEVMIPWRGKNLPFRLRKSLTIGEKQAAMEKAVSISVTKEGIPKIERMDQGAYSREIALKAITFWPFEFSRGKPVPINKETIAKIDGSLLEKIVTIVTGQDQQQEQALGPFEMKFGEG